MSRENDDSYDVFVSFAAGDEGVAIWVTRCLESVGFKVFCYLDHVSTAHWRDRLLPILLSSKAVIVLASTNSVHSSMQKAEYDTAVDGDIPIVGLRIGDVDVALRKTNAMLGFLAATWLVPSGDWHIDAVPILESLKDARVEPTGQRASKKFPAESEDEKHLDLLIRATKNQKSEKKDIPRPKVAASLVWNDQELWCAERQNSIHAEQLLLKRARLIPQGTTLYTTLEPCSKSERGYESCADAIAASLAIERVVIANIDCNPEMRGRGISRLQERRKDVALASASRAHEAQRDNSEYFAYFNRAAARKRILIAVPAFQEMPFFAELLQALLREFDVKKLDAVPALLGSHDDTTAQEKFLLALPSRQSDYQGFVFFPTPPKPALRRQFRSMPTLLGKPVVYLDIDPFENEETVGGRTYFVGSQSGGKEAADVIGQHLKQLGNDQPNRVLVICSRSIKPERRRDFVRELEGQPVQVIVEAGADSLDRAEGRKLTRKHLAGQSFSAIYAINDELAIGAYEAIQDLNPKESIVPPLVLGFDGLHEMQERIRGGYGGLATLVQDLDGIAEQVVEILQAELGDNGDRVAAVRSHRKYEFPPKLFPRRLPGTSR